MTDSHHRDPMQEFADRIVSELEKGVKPWVRPWDPDKAGGPQAPFNPATGKHYHGVNVLILGMDVRAFESGDPRWMTYQQAHEKNWQVRKGERSTTIFFAKPLEIDDDEQRGRQKDDQNAQTLSRVPCLADRRYPALQGSRPSRKLRGHGPKPPTS